LYKSSLRKYRRKKEDDLEPLKKVPDYTNQKKRGSFSADKHTALNVNRIYFVDENYDRLIVSSEEVRTGGDLTRFTGQLPFIPERGDILSNDDFSRRFEVIRRHMVPQLSTNIPPKIYIVMKEIKV